MLENLLKIPLKNVLGNMFGSGVAAAASLCLTGLLSWWEDDFDTDPEVTDLAATGTHDAIPSKYLYIDTVGYSITFAGMGAGVTLTSHSGTATCALSSGTLTCSAAGTLHQLILSDGTKYSCGESVGTLIAPDVAGINGTLVGFTLPTDRKPAATEGKTWNRASFIIADGGGTFDSGSYLPASYTSEGTLYSGTALQNLDVDAASVGVFDGTAFAEPANPIDLVSTIAGAIEARYEFGTIDARAVLNIGTASDRCSISFGTVGLAHGGLGDDGFATIVSDTPGVPGQTYTVKLSWNGSTVTLTQDEVVVYQAAQNGVVSLGATPSIGSNPGGNEQYTSVIEWVKVYDSTDTIVNHWIVQAASDSVQTTVYDVGPSANHAAITGGTFPDFWTGTANVSWLAQWGGRLAGGVTIPGRTTGLAADGNALTFSNYLDAPANSVTITVPETAEMFGAIPSLFTAGVPDATDPAGLLESFDAEWRGTDVGIIVTDGVQTGTCRDTTDDYLYPGGVTYIVDESGDFVLDESGNYSIGV